VRVNSPLDSEYHGRLIALAALSDMKSDQLGRLLCRHGLDSLWRLFIGGHRVSTRDKRHSPHDSRPDGTQLSFDEAPMAYLPDLRVKQWGAELRAADLCALTQLHQRAGVQVLTVLDSNFPAALLRQKDAPGVVFVRGNRELLDGFGEVSTPRRVAIVGTRKATSYGRQVARSFGRTFAAHGVSVVSGLASGIDGSAHSGSLQERNLGDAPPIAVVGSGLDTVYPAGNRQLWAAVEHVGVVVSEWPLGANPLPWHFPARNRLIVALSEAVVVVESAEKGGSMLTVTQAVNRNVPVFAVPGPITSAVSAGTNALLATINNKDSFLCQGSLDVLRHLQLTDDSAGILHSVPDSRRPPDGDSAALLRLMGWDVLTIEGLLSRLPGVSSGMVLLTLHELEFDGWVARGSDGWFQLAPRG
jgi:DNA processing protein